MCPHWCADCFALLYLLFKLVFIEIIAMTLSFWKLWNLSFGFFGVQIAYALQSSQVSRIFSTIGADPHDLSYFWILPPLMGLIVQPIVGAASDRTWNRLGRRLPYLVVGALIDRKSVV